MYKNKSQLLFRRLCLIVVDIISIILSFFLSAFIAYDGSMELSFLKYTYFFIPILLIGSLFFFIIMKLYDSLWSYASINELLNVIIASILYFMFAHSSPSADKYNIFIFIIITCFHRWKPIWLSVCSSLCFKTLLVW